MLMKLEKMRKQMEAKGVNFQMNADGSAAKGFITQDEAGFRKIIVGAKDHGLESKKLRKMDTQFWKNQMFIKDEKHE